MSQHLQYFSSLKGKALLWSWHADVKCLVNMVGHWISWKCDVCFIEKMSFFQILLPEQKKEACKLISLACLVKFTLPRHVAKGGGIPGSEAPSPIGPFFLVIFTIVLTKCQFRLVSATLQHPQTPSLDHFWLRL